MVQNMLETKLRGMQGKLLTQHALDQLGQGIHCLYALANHPSYDYLQVGEGHRVSLQNQLYISYLRDVNKLTKVAPRTPALVPYQRRAQVVALQMFYLGLGQVGMAPGSQVFEWCSGGVMKGFHMVQLAQAGHQPHQADARSLFLQGLGTSPYRQLLAHVPFAQYPAVLDFYLQTQEGTAKGQHTRLDKYMTSKQAEIQTLIRLSEGASIGASP